MFVILYKNANVKVETDIKYTWHVNDSRSTEQA